jgi:hypothetical protein
MNKQEIEAYLIELDEAGEASLVYELTKTTKRIRQIISAIGKRHGLPPKDRMFFNDDCALF